MRIRDRIKALRRVKASELKAHPRNWRTHPQQQREAVQAILKEIGYADALLGRELPDGKIELLDGHLRADITARQKVPVLLVDLTDEEADKLLAVHDPLAALAEANSAPLEELLATTSFEDSNLQDVLDDLASSAGLHVEEGRVQLKQLATKPPPAMSWVLIGIPTVRFGEIAATVEGLAEVEGTIIETTSNDGNEDGQ